MRRGSQLRQLRAGPCIGPYCRRCGRRGRLRARAGEQNFTFGDANATRMPGFLSQSRHAASMSASWEVPVGFPGSRPRLQPASTVTRRVASSSSTARRRSSMNVDPLGVGIAAGVSVGEDRCVDGVSGPAGADQAALTAGAQDQGADLGLAVGVVVSVRADRSARRLALPGRHLISSGPDARRPRGPADRFPRSCSVAGWAPLYSTDFLGPDDRRLRQA